MCTLNVHVDRAPMRDAQAHLGSSCGAPRDAGFDRHTQA
jgi:hypothetical protein